ncbi:hypothetical protein R84B8_01525 [Treponema sp. R8-4-B8]
MDWHILNAQVEEINAFSAHADYFEILEWMKAVDTSRLKKIFLVHGEKKAQAHWKKYLEENGYPDVEIVKFDIPYDMKV